MRSPLLLIKERPDDAKAIEALIARSFGPERNKLTVYKLRSACPPIADLSFVAIDAQGYMRGSIRYWPVLIEGSDLRTVILGPLAVDEDQQGKGVGKALITRSLEEAQEQDYDLCLVVGDQRLYTGFAFSNATRLGLQLPGWVDPARFQLKELRKGCLSGEFTGGMIHPFC